MINVRPLSISDPKFPAAFECVTEGSDKGLVVIFTSQDTGMVVVASKYHKVGHFESAWTICTRADMWKPVNVSLTH